MPSCAGAASPPASSGPDTNPGIKPPIALHCRPFIPARDCNLETLHRRRCQAQPLLRDLPDAADARCRTRRPGIRPGPGQDQMVASLPRHCPGRAGNRHPADQTVPLARPCAASGADRAQPVPRAVLSQRLSGRAVPAAHLQIATLAVVQPGGTAGLRLAGRPDPGLGQLAAQQSTRSRAEPDALELRLRQPGLAAQPTLSADRPTLSTTADAGHQSPPRPDPDGLHPIATDRYRDRATVAVRPAALSPVVPTLQQRHGADHLQCLFATGHGGRRLDAVPRTPRATAQSQGQGAGHSPGGRLLRHP